ncbi:amino acid ABC transporter [Vibrio orientalis CIP 102891 = ATCC 33934]|uniref:Amino acid ABC transporter n=1 Tax=Vibrio orientalis CIP 102891 = ATCC 33934 TaxID=675816 RepID=C9QFX5_VIBOR|nr:transporter substrate-binding domain-containing protein [Vibrio orientalis]EEX94320.1 probable amino acid ABC transporter [Vibrio orientalis CIP 102891 = ATCC 33934]EGU54137.1 amino acid ABC transporter [Vibrio orientalis CIP 102891 = ATCC 33934]
MLRFTDIIVVCVITLASFTAYAHNTKLTHVRVCGDAIDWPPYTYVKDEEAYGFDIDVLNEALMAQGVSYQITMTSWSRCLKGTKSGEFDLAVSASFNSKRDKDYIYTEWYYSITPYYIYSTQRFPQGLNITNINDLSEYKVCGNHGYNYADFGLNEIIRGGNSVKDVLTRLEQGNCEVYLNWIEIIDGIKTIWGLDYISDGLAAKPIPDMSPHKFYMLISRKFSAHNQLKSMLDSYLRTVRNHPQSD